MPSSVVGNKPQAYDKIIGVDATGGESCSTNVCTGRCSVASRRHLINIPFLGEFVTAENQWKINDNQAIGDSFKNPPLSVCSAT